jgi:hypothetical protein
MTGRSNCLSAAAPGLATKSATRPGVTLFAASDKQAAAPQDDDPVAYRLQS